MVINDILISIHASLARCVTRIPKYLVTVEISIHASLARCVALYKALYSY